MRLAWRAFGVERRGVKLSSTAEPALGVPAALPGRSSAVGEEGPRSSSDPLCRRIVSRVPQDSSKEEALERLLALEEAARRVFFGGLAEGGGLMSGL